jgi:hypothetical protein
MTRAGVDIIVVKVWVKQVRNVSNDVEDTLREFAENLVRQSWWRICRTLLDRRRVATNVKQYVVLLLRAQPHSPC